MAKAALWSVTDAEARKRGELRSIERIEASTMPSVSGALTASELDDLIAYLFSLRKESGT